MCLQNIQNSKYQDVLGLHVGHPYTSREGACIWRSWNISGRFTTNTPKNHLLYIVIFQESYNTPLEHTSQLVKVARGVFQFGVLKQPSNEDIRLRSRLVGSYELVKSSQNKDLFSAPNGTMALPPVVK